MRDLNPDKLRKDALRYVKQYDDANLKLSEILYQIRAHALWKSWGYKSFQEYVDTELSISRRKADYLVQTWTWFTVDNDLKDVLKSLGWSKAIRLVGVITDKNKDDILKNVVNLNVDEISAYVKNVKESQSTDVENFDKDVIIRETFLLTKEQAVNLESALIQAQKMSGSSKKGNLLDLICTEFLANCILQSTSEYLDNVERSTDTKLIAIKDYSVVYGKVKRRVRNGRELILHIDLS